MHLRFILPFLEASLSALLLFLSSSLLFSLSFLFVFLSFLFFPSCWLFAWFVGVLCFCVVGLSGLRGFGLPRVVLLWLLLLLLLLLFFLFLFLSRLLFSVLGLLLAPCVSFGLWCRSLVLGLRLAPRGFCLPRSLGVGRLPARVAPASARWHRPRWCCLWFVAFMDLLPVGGVDGSDSSSSADEAVEDYSSMDRLCIAG